MDEKEVEAFVEEEEVIYSKHIAMHEKTRLFPLSLSQEALYLPTFSHLFDCQKTSFSLSPFLSLSLRDLKFSIRRFCWLHDQGRSTWSYL